MGIPLYLPTVEIGLGSTSTSLNFHSDSTDLKYCMAAVLSVLQRDSPSAVSPASALTALSAVAGGMSLTSLFFFLMLLNAVGAATNAVGAAAGML